MRFVATYTVEPDPSRIESHGRGGTMRVEFEAHDIAAALTYCAFRKLMYFGPLAEDKDKRQ
jgi:hypothetical protein